MRGAAGALGLVLVVATVAGPAAAAGKVDPTFGSPSTPGLARMNLGTATDRVFAAAARPGDGHVVLAGTSGGTGERFAIGVFDENGVQDTTFSGDGALDDDHTSGLDILTAVVGQPDGKVVVAGTAGAGSTTSAIWAARYQTGGSLDWDTDVGAPGDSAGALALQPGTGSVVVAGSTHPTASTVDLVLARLEPDGDLDATFSGDGLLTDDRAGMEQPAGVVAQADGRIVVAALARAAGGDDLAVARYQADGTPDPTFSGDGVKTLDFGGPDSPCGVTVTPAGKVVVAATVRAAGSDDVLANWQVARLRANGKLDRKFSGDGKKRIDMGGNDRCNDLLLDSRGRVVATGEVQLAGGAHRLGAARLTKRGTLDPTFSGDGRTRIAVGGNDVTGGYGALQAGDRVIVAGSGQGVDARDFLAVRLS